MRVILEHQGDAGNIVTIYLWGEEAECRRWEGTLKNMNDTSADGEKIDLKAEQWNEQEIPDFSVQDILVIPVTETLLQKAELRNIVLQAVGAGCTLFPIGCFPDDKEHNDCFQQIFGALEYFRAGNVLAQGKLLQDLHLAIRKKEQFYEQVRNCLKSGLFLSYRKIDVKELLKLDSLLREIPGFELFPIWYDHRLVAGENYEEDIERVIEDCKVFVLLVTPNILEEDNYVMRIEYPRACSLQKEILAVEMIPTDRKALSEKYPGLDHVFTIEEMMGVAHFLAVKCGHQDDRAPLSADEYYRIGFAFQEGVTVDPNPECAQDALIQALDEGQEDALLYLMYLYAYQKLPLPSQRILEHVISGMLSYLEGALTAVPNGSNYSLYSRIDSVFRQMNLLIGHTTRAAFAREMWEKLAELFQLIYPNPFKKVFYSSYDAIIGYEKIQENGKWKTGEAIFEKTVRQTGSVTYMEQGKALENIYRSLSRVCAMMGDAEGVNHYKNLELNLAIQKMRLKKDTVLKPERSS